MQELNITPLFLGGILCLGLFIGVLTGLFGVGGGFLLTPCLKFFFALPYPVAVGSSLASIFCVGTVSAFRHGRRGNVAWGLGFLMAAGGLSGTLAGAQVMTVLQRAALVVEFAGRRLHLLDITLHLLFLLLLAGVFFIVRWETSHPPGMKCPAGEPAEPVYPLAERLHGWRLPPYIGLPIEQKNISVWVPLGLGLSVGFLTGLLGVGGGFVLFPALVYVIGLPTLSAVGTSALQLVFAGAFGSLLYARRGLVEPLVVLTLVIGAMLGAEIGVRLAGIINPRRLRRHFGYVVGAGIIVVLLDLIFMAKDLKGT